LSAAPFPSAINGEMVGETISHYRIIKKIGQGGMGEVYRAEDIRLGRHVVLKFLPVELAATGGSMARFRREARAVSVLNHPNICTLHDIGDHNGQPFIVMELLEGQTLGSRLADSSLEKDELAELAIQVGRALVAAREKNIIHRDIKPANVFLTETGQVKLLEFGLAKLVAHSPHMETPTTLDEQADGPSPPPEWASAPPTTCLRNS